MNGGLMVCWGAANVDLRLLIGIRYLYVVEAHNQDHSRGEAGETAGEVPL
jgi:hypothetical protein